MANTRYVAMDYFQAYAEGLLTDWSKYTGREIFIIDTEYVNNGTPAIKDVTYAQAAAAYKCNTLNGISIPLKTR